MASRATGSFRRNREKAYTNNILKYGNITCEYCGKNELERNCAEKHGATIDHKVPISSGGSVGSLSNMVVCCHSCNQKKGSMSYEDFKNKNEKDYDFINTNSFSFICA
jgi:5-methylcytosine-specific restriction endonuclease McrA